MAARDYKFEYMLLNRLQCDCNYYLGHGGRNAQHCLWAHDEQKQIDKESFMTCCRLNLNGLQENKLMNMQQEWA